MLNFSFSPLLLLILQNAAGTDVFMKMKMLGTKLPRRAQDLHISQPFISICKGSHHVIRPIAIMLEFRPQNFHTPQL
jgi:hypothetical protein